MTSRLPKPSGLKPPQIRGATRPLVTISENYINRHHEAPAAPITRTFPNFRHRRSKSTTDLHMIPGKSIDVVPPKVPHAKKDPPPKNGPGIRSTKPATAPTKAGISGTKRPHPATSENDGQPKPKKLPDWDYKGRFKQLQEQYLLAKKSLNEMNAKMGEFDEIKCNYEKVQDEARELAERKELLRAQCELLSYENKTLKENNERVENKLTILEKKHRHLEADFITIEEHNQKLLEETETSSKEVMRLSDSLNSLIQIHEKLTEEHKALTKKHIELSEKYKHITQQNEDLLEGRDNNHQEIKELKQVISIQKTDLQQSHIERRRLHNIIQDLKGNIRVFCRVRPPINADEQDRLQCFISFIDENGLEIRKSRESVSQITGKVQDIKSEFMFDKVFAPESTQAEIFEDLSQLVQSALDGYHVCVFAYGQTGSGKTYTMQGGENPEGKGMVPRTIDLLFQTIADLERTGWKYAVHASFLEIYNEIPNDLLNINGSQKLEICFNEGKGTTVTNLTIQPIESACELKEFMTLAHKNRATAATNFNEHSSRSHAVTKIYLEGTMADEDVMYKGSINLVDLAGSESAKQSVIGERLTETKNINKSLATLGDVISALHCKSKHIPYRNSKLTYLLQSCLGGNSKTLMVVNISPFEDCYNESISSLRFAAKVKEVKTASKKNKIAKQKSTLT